MEYVAGQPEQLQADISGNQTVETLLDSGVGQPEEAGESSKSES